MNKELLLDENGILRNHFRDCKGAVRMVYTDTYNAADAGEILHGYWHSNGEYNGLMYTKAVSRNFGNVSVRLFSRGAFNNGKIFEFQDNKVYHKGNQLDEKQSEKILSDTIKQMVAFDIRHKTNVYQKAIEELKCGINKYMLEILEMDLAKL